MKKPFISVVVPVYNAEKYLSECIESVINQKVKEWQMILVNDGSTDSSGEICKKYLKVDKRIIYIEQENQGVSVARNTGIDCAEGDWIVFLDADDMLMSCAFDIPKHVDSSCEVIITGMARSIVDFNYSEEGDYILSEEAQSAILNLASFKKRYPNIVGLTDYNNWVGCGKFFKLSCLRKNNIYFTRGIKLGEDLLFCFQLYSYTKNIWINRSKIYYYRENLASASRVFRADRVSNTEFLIKEIKKGVYTPKLKKCLNYFIIDRLTKCCFEYYSSKESGLTIEEATEKLKELCEKDEYFWAIQNCNYRNLACGKKNRIYIAVTLLCLKRKKYKLLLKIIQFLQKEK